MTTWNYVMIISAVIMIVLILLQIRGAGLGAGLGGGGGEVNTVRRGSERSIFLLTIIAATVFALSIFIELLIG